MNLIIKKNFDLKNYNNYKIKTKAKYFWQVKNYQQLLKALNFAKKEKIKVFILGEGTNILLIDKKNNLSCLEWAGGLPGSLGGAIKGNAGAFKREIKDNLIKVFSININQPYKIITRTKKQCFFDYRTSIFKKRKNEIILAAQFKFKLKNKKIIEKEVKEKIEYRKLKTPYFLPCAGSVFKNVPINQVPKKVLKIFENKIKFDPKPLLPAAVLIDKVNLKNKRKNDALISNKHPNFIVNLKNTKSSDIKYLINLIKKMIYKKFKIKLKKEIVII